MAKAECDEGADDVPFLLPDSHSGESDKSIYVSVWIPIDVAYVLSERLTLDMPTAMLAVH